MRTFLKMFLSLLLVCSSAHARHSYCIGHGYYTLEDLTYTYEVQCNKLLLSGRTGAFGRIFMILTQSRKQALKSEVVSEVVSNGYKSMIQISLDHDYDLFVRSSEMEADQRRLCSIFGDKIVQCSKGTQLLQNADGSVVSAHKTLSRNGFTFETEILSSNDYLWSWKIYSK